MDSEQESEGRRDSDASLDESETGSIKSSEYSHSISSNLSGSSSDDYIQVDPKIVFNSVSSGVASAKSQSDAKLLSQSVKSSKTSTSSTSQVSDVTHESGFSTMSTTQSPSIQVMDREAGFDPNKIPSSIFGSKDSSSKEWSTASKESLFSIHTAGNGSPARDHVVTTDGDFKRSRKHDNFTEVAKNEEINKAGEQTRFRQTLPIAKGGEHKKKIFEKERKVDAINNPLATGSSDEATKRVVRFREEIKAREKKNHSIPIGLSGGNVCFGDSCADVRNSDGNGTSSAFPIGQACLLAVGNGHAAMVVAIDGRGTIYVENDNLNTIIPIELHSDFKEYNTTASLSSCDSRPSCDSCIHALAVDEINVKA
ncbi:hypothetical protein RND71_010549 [Anisodus tanguticus]|uniref:Uncharacterized protein n=1 Tax=Anisodus tanguticus TaxID=243964 RepID=A0AAE1SK05_9SOLA|nr:hypothetical protein RND71_010549 [Anisodus tanguticus]